MIISGPDTTSIKEKPGAGNSFGITGEWAEFLRNYEELFSERGIMVDISPPVLNTDNTVVYEFQNNAGTTDTNGKQTAGLWVAETVAGEGQYITAVGVFDQKKSFDTVEQITTRTPYVLSDGEGEMATTYLTHTGSFVAGSVAPYDEYEIRVSETNKGGQTSTGVENPNNYSFNPVEGRPDTQLLSYDLFWGTDSEANYGPFNLSSGDLLTMTTFIQEGVGGGGLNGQFASFSHQRSQTSLRGPTFTSTNVVNPDEDSLEPVIMEMTSSKLGGTIASSYNMHVCYTKTYTKYGE